MRKITYITSAGEATTDIPPEFPAPFHEILTIATASTTDGDIRCLDISALVLIPYVERSRLPKDAASNAKYSTMESKVVDSEGTTYRIWIVTSTDDSDIIPIINSVLSPVRERVQPFVATLNYHLHLAEIMPAIKKLRDKMTPPFDARKLHIPPKNVSEVIKFHLPCISQEEQQDVIHTIQLIPVNASSYDFQFSVIDRALTSVLSLSDETIAELRADIYKPTWEKMLAIVKKMKPA